MECPFIPEISYHNFIVPLYKKAMAKRVPIGISMELTQCCNLNCVHCYVPRKYDNKELDYKDICRVIDMMVEEGCLWLLLTGGEIFTRKDFLDIYVYAKKKGLCINLFTNGTLIDHDIADILNEFPPSLIEISLYGITKETYEAVTQTHGSYERCRRGINLLLERSLPVRLKTVAMDINQHEIWKIKEFAKELNVGFRFSTIIFPKLNGCKDPIEHRISPEEVVKLDMADKDRLENFLKFIEKRQKMPQTKFLYNCRAGKNSCHIDAYGNLFLCISNRTVSYDLKKGDFREGWRHFLPQLLSQQQSAKYECGSCELKPFCDNCPAYSFLENGNLEATVPYFCSIARLRMNAFR